MKINKRTYLLLFASALLLLAGACSKELESYDEIVRHELARQEKYDSLFMGIHFNMHMQDFYDHCFEMNQQELFFKNPGSVDVRYTFKEGFRAPVDFVFFPKDGHTLIQKVTGQMVYQTWSPFTKEYNAEKLQEELVENMEQWYGGRPFIKVKHPKDFWPYSYVKIDGNRKIQLYRSFDDRQVEVIFENLDYYYDKDE